MFDHLTFLFSFETWLLGLVIVVIIWWTTRKCIALHWFGLVWFGIALHRIGVSVCDYIMAFIISIKMHDMRQN